MKRAGVTADDLAFPRRSLPARVETDENSLQRGLAQLVLLLVDILGELLEPQTVRVDELYDELVGEPTEQSMLRAVG
jgi:Gas vesicle protein K